MSRLFQKDGQKVEQKAGQKAEQPGQHQAEQIDGFELWVAGQLRERQPYLADGGFSERVMSGLPARPRRLAWRAGLGLLLLAVLGVFLLSFMLWSGVAPLLAWVQQLQSLTLLGLLQLGMAMGLCIMLAGGLAIWRVYSRE